jgi:hypothetical protein
MILCIAAIVITNSFFISSISYFSISYSKLKPAVKRTTEKSFLRGGVPVGLKEYRRKNPVQHCRLASLPEIVLS